MTPDTLVILNPASAGGSGGNLRDRLREVLSLAGLEAELRVTGARGDAERWAAEAAAGGRKRVVAAGGDGTVHEVANGLLSGERPTPELGILPMGTGNDFFKMVTGNASLDSAVRILMEGAPRPFDAGRVSWGSGSRHFVNLLGVGLDVEVLRQRDRFRRLPGLPQYMAALAVAALRYRARPLRVETDEAAPLEGPTLLAAVTVGPSVGGGFRLTPDARADDGVLDLCHVAPLGYWTIMRSIPKVLNGRHTELEEVRVRTLHRARIQPMDGELLPFEVDGELVAEPARLLEVEVRPGVLPVVMPGRERR